MLRCIEKCEYTQCYMGEVTVRQDTTAAEHDNLSHNAKFESYYAKVRITVSRRTGKQMFSTVTASGAVTVEIICFPDAVAISTKTCSL